MKRLCSRLLYFVLPTVPQSCSSFAAPAHPEQRGPCGWSRQRAAPGRHGPGDGAAVTAAAGAREPGHAAAAAATRRRSHSRLYWSVAFRDLPLLGGWDCFELLEVLGESKICLSSRSKFILRRAVFGRPSSKRGEVGAWWVSWPTTPISNGVTLPAHATSKIARMKPCLQVQRLRTCPGWRPVSRARTTRSSQPRRSRGNAPSQRLSPRCKDTSTSSRTLTLKPPIVSTRTDCLNQASPQQIGRGRGVMHELMFGKTLRCSAAHGPGRGGSTADGVAVRK